MSYSHKYYSKNVIIVGKIPPPYYGTSIWTNILYKSGCFEIFNSKINESLKNFGKIRIFKILKTFYIYLKFLIYLKKSKPKISVIPISQSLLGFIKDSIFIFIAVHYSKKVILFLHGGNFKNWFDNKNILIKSFVKFTFKFTFGVIVLGDKLKNIFKPFFPYERIYIAPNGIDVTFPHFDKKNDHKITILYLGNLQPSKGIKIVIYSIKRLKKYNIDFKLNVIGDWRDIETRNWVLKYIDEMKLPINFLGPKYKDEKYMYLQASDIFIFTPIAEEGHPFVIIEAMAAGLPIISTNRGAITESVIDNLNGFIVDPNDSEDIAEKLRILIKNKDLREKMGRESRQLYEKKFTEEHMLNRLKTIFNTVINL